MGHLFFPANEPVAGRICFVALGLGGQAVWVGGFRGGAARIG